jgi:hypothetical protein
MARIVVPAPYMIGTLAPELAQCAVGFALPVLEAVSRLEREGGRRKVSRVLVRG